MDIKKLANVEMGNIVLQVDEETATEIRNDANIAQLYMVETQIPQASQVRMSCSEGYPMCTLWKSAKNPTKQDHEATLAFLALRKEFNKEFSDKKTSKNLIWGKIASSMNDMGFYVGAGAEGREKCRQKFANLQSTYIKTKDKRRLTGEGAIKNPPYFDELEDILGDKHKVQPVFLIDSTFKESSKETLTRSSLNSSNSSEICKDSVNNPSPSTSSTNTQHRFSNIKKTARPKKDTILETVEKINNQNQENRKAEFQQIIELMKIQNEQRHQQIMALITNNDSQKNKTKNKKRPRTSSDDED